MKPIFVIVAFSALLAGCAASRQEAAARLGERFIGKSVDVMAGEFGPPASSFRLTSGGSSYQWQLADGADVVGGRGIAMSSQRHCKVNVMTDAGGRVVDLKTDDTGSATSYGYFAVNESLCAKRFGMKAQS